LAQGILQTQAGENPLAETGNNFFKIRANSTWHGKTYRAKTGIYRAYPSAWASFRDHSEYITSGKFKNLVFSGTKNYTAWAAGLQANGFCKESDYANKLISIIESENLANYDN
jgi:flagellum-specific peptidoglycan hydrolase FlgJ